MTSPDTHPTNLTPEPSNPQRPDDYGPVQACKRLDLSDWQLDRAIAGGLIPAPPVSGRWPAAVIEDAAARRDEIAAAAGDIPDVGAVNAAQYLTTALGTDVSTDAVAELHRIGRLPHAGTYMGHQLYCGRTLQTLTEAATAANGSDDPAGPVSAAAVREVLARAERDGALHTRAQAATRLGIRRADLDHLTAAGLLTPTAWVRSMWTRCHDAPDVPLYRAGDLDALTAHPGIDWDAGRATPPGRPSPLRHLTTTPTATPTGSGTVTKDCQP